MPNPIIHIKIVIITEGVKILKRREKYKMRGVAVKRDPIRR